MNLSLFSTKPGESGFRLHSYQVWNWGTFDGHIYTIEPGGETSLLTGANASGKTTLVDGLLTLLVPERRMRFYNQTAGAKGERTEDSYVVGEWGETENAETNTRETKKLRGDKSRAQSVLLAVFQNESQFVTLAQARWFSGAELKRSFMLAHKQLSIAADFMPFDSQGDWKKRLKQALPRQGSREMLHLMDGPGEYGRLMRKVFGMRSEKAHTLFSQTIGLKVLGDLNEFVRSQMLEERDSEAEFQKIRTHFKTLNDAHKAILKAHKQLELLSPIREKDRLLQKKQAKLQLQEAYQQTAPLWFARRQQGLIQEFVAAKTSEAQGLEEEKERLEQEIGQLSDQERELDLQIRNDEVGKQISQLERSSRELEARKAEREEELRRYNKLAQLLELQPDPKSRELFDEQRATASQRKKALGEALELNGEDEMKTRIRRNALDEELKNISNELSVLRAQKNNITGHPARIRSELLEHTGASEKELPFMGELIRVRDDSREWEGAIERLLHNFALRLLVPEAYYQQVNDYVSRHDLRGRIIYHRYSKKEGVAQLFQQQPQEALIHKLDFKPTPYTDWVKAELAKSFDYLCAEDMEAFRLSHKALLQSGLIKNGSRHEKDDRPEARSRQQYVLGWDNKEKIALLRQEAERLNGELSQLDQQLKHLKNQRARLEQEREDLARFLDFTAFKKLDWWSLSTQLLEYQQQIEALQKTNDRVNTLRQQRDEMLQALKSKGRVLDSLKDRLNESRLMLQQQAQKLQELEEIMAPYAGLAAEDAADALAHFEKEFIAGQAPGLSTIAGLQRQVSSKISQSLERLRDEIREASSAAEALMRAFTHPDKAVTDAFEDWNADTHRLRASVEFIDEYVALLERIEKQELASYKQQFKRYLNEEMITKMSDFQTWLERQEEEIEENIDILNESLGRINFKSNPPTFIKLYARKDYSPKVKEFKSRLSQWKPNTFEYQRTQDDSILEESFGKIKALLDGLTADESSRKEVLDVRNWLRFEAVEHHREDPTKPFRSYTGTAKLSGGEGAQLTYTILGSAIAYQFGIHSEGLNTHSFRFICVDEAFSKQDDEKARFLMELCKQLHLQLMVVSPAKAEEVAIVEPYIARVHFVQRKDNRHSVVYDMPIHQLQEHRQRFLEEVE